MSRFYNCDHNPEIFSGASLQVTNHLQFLSKTEKPEQPVSVATPGFLPRWRPWKPTMKKDVFYSAPKSVVNVEALKRKSTSIRQILATKKEIWFGFWQVISPQSFLMINK